MSDWPTDRDHPDEGILINSPGVMTDVEAVARRLVDSFKGVIEPITGPEPKLADLAQTFSLDRTQAWRIGRLLVDPDPLAALFEAPAPRGLGQTLEAAERVGAARGAVLAAREAVAAFAALIHRFPDGRAGLDAALSSRVPKAQEAAAKAARKRISQGMGQLLGLRAAVRYVASILMPSPGQAELADVVAVAGYKDLRRLRLGPSPVVFSGKTYTRSSASGGGGASPAVVTLEGLEDPDPRLRLLAEFSDPAADALHLETIGNELRLVLAPDVPGVNEPITMFFGQRIARSLSRYRTRERWHELVHHAPVLPSEVNVFDTFIHRDLFPEADPPMVTVERFGFNPVVQALRPEDGSYRVDTAEEPKSLGRGLGRSAMRSVPRVTEMLASAFARVGANPEEFRGYRTTLEHVPPGFAVVVWCPLPAGPSGSAAPMG